MTPLPIYKKNVKVLFCVSGLSDHFIFFPKKKLINYCHRTGLLLLRTGPVEKVSYCIFCILIHLQKEFLQPSGRTSSVQDSSSINFSLSTKKIGFLQPSGRDSSVQQYASVKLSLHQENRIFHPSDRASSVQESTSVKPSISTMKIGFSTPVAGLHLFKNLLLSSHHSPP